jgi:hypothetical protein
VARSRGLETRGKNLNGNIIITTGRKRERERETDRYNIAQDVC